jgi:hypothetical protein
VAILAPKSLPERQKDVWTVMREAHESSRQSSPVTPHTPVRMQKRLAHLPLKERVGITPLAKPREKNA